MRIVLLCGFDDIPQGIESSDIQILELEGDTDESLHALFGDIATTGEREMLQLRAVVRQQSKGVVIDLGSLKACMFQLRTRCDQVLDVNAAEP